MQPVIYSIPNSTIEIIEVSTCAIEEYAECCIPEQEQEDFLACDGVGTGNRALVEKHGKAMVCAYGVHKVVEEFRRYGMTEWKGMNVLDAVFWLLHMQCAHLDEMRFMERGE